MEALVNFCRQPTFMSEMYANLDCDVTHGNIFEEGESSKKGAASQEAPEESN